MSDVGAVSGASEHQYQPQDQDELKNLHPQKNLFKQVSSELDKDVSVNPDLPSYADLAAMLFKL